MADQTPTNSTPVLSAAQAFWMTNFDKVTLWITIMVFVFLLIWIDKHNNSDLEKWLQNLTFGLGGAWLGLLTGQRIAKSGGSNGSTNGNSNGNGTTPAKS